ncbi:unnamed protein product [Discula destructiva]
MFRPSKGLSPDIFMIDGMACLWAANKAELLKFREDKSGRLKKALPGPKDRPMRERYWATQYHLHSEFLARSDAVNLLGDLYYERFSERAELIPVGEWNTTSVMEFMMNDMSQSALVTFMGTRILELNPGFMDDMSKFILTAAELPVFGINSL